VSGANADYPSLAEAEADGLFHPNCGCELIYFEEKK
jgi:hypothetical protein